MTSSKPDKSVPQTRRNRSREDASGDEGGNTQLARVSVVIVNFNTGALLAQVVQSVFAQSLAPMECIVVDNASSDDSLAQLRSAVVDERLSILELESNLGFAAGCNRGITASTGSHVLLLNPDCFMDEGALRALLSEFSHDKEVGAVGPLILNMDGSEQRGCRRDIPTPWQIFCVGLGLHRLMPNHPRFRSFNRAGEDVPDEPVQVQSVSGACLLIRRDTLENVGYLDARYFLHFEDLDWCLRAGAAGWKVHFVPDAVAHHVGGVSGRKRRYSVEAHKHASLIRFVRANFASYYPSAFIAFVSVIVYARWLTVVVRMALLGRSQGQKGWYNLFVGSKD